MSKNYTGVLSLPLNFKYISKHVNFSKKLEEWREEFYTDMIPMDGGWKRDEKGPKSYYDYEQFEESFNSSIWVRGKREDGVILWEEHYRDKNGNRIFDNHGNNTCQRGYMIDSSEEQFNILEAAYKNFYREKKLERILTL